MALIRLDDYTEARCDRCRALGFRVTAGGQVITLCRKDKHPVTASIDRLPPYAEIVSAASALVTQRRAGVAHLAADWRRLEAGLDAIDRRVLALGKW